MTREWDGYLGRRKAGGPRELLPTADDAKAWLVEIAPLKLVDGAWLGQVHRITTTRFALRRVTKAAWQVLSEELGDGDLDKCHTHVFARLLEQNGLPVPAPDSPEFTQHAGMDGVGVWRSALAQLLISRFAHEFFPEILGFNLHFEMLTLEMLVAARELRELGIDPYYFTLHITIDNAHTGHTAMASRIVADYLELVAEMRGAAAVQGGWKRVQAGYILSKNIGRRRQHRDMLREKVLEIFRAKSVACSRIHDHCPMKLRGRSLGTWLDPTSFSRSPGWRADFLQCLEAARPWIVKGESSRSRLVKQCAWGGRMFGAFTDREVATIRDWIDSLAPPGPDTYTRFAGRPDMGQEASHADAEVRDQKNLMTRPDILGRVSLGGSSTTPESTGVTGPLAVDIRTLNIHKLLPIWFAHSSLFESMVSVPWTVADPTGCAIVRLLRAQYGFPREPVGVYGVDEMSRADTVDLVSIGLELTLAANPGMTPLPADMAAVLAHWPSRFAEDMLAAATRPRRLQWQLLGMACAFVQLHGVLAASPNSLLSEQTRAALDVMRRREEESLAVCRASLRPGSLACRDFEEGCLLAVREIESCF